jgi:hypothetical protein
MASVLAKIIKEDRIKGNYILIVLKIANRLILLTGFVEYLLLFTGEAGITRL